MYTNNIEVKLVELRPLILENLSLLGLTPQESEVVMEVLLYAQLRDKAQGLVKILEKTVAPDADRTAIGIESRAAAINLVHANGHCGMVVLERATTLTIDTCASTGLALTGTRGTASSTGSIGYYAERIAAAGYIAMLTAGSPKVMAVNGSRLPALGTNPLAMAVPTRGHPLVLDMATAATTWFDLLQSAKDEVAIAEDLALDAAGHPTTDASEAIKGVMLTFGGSKGSGLALMLEMLSGPLMGATLAGEAGDCRGNFILAINPRLLMDDYSLRVEQLLDTLRKAPLQQGNKILRLPGEHSAALARERLARAVVPIRRDIYQQLKDRVKS